MGNSSKAQLARFEAAFQKYLDVYMTGRNLEMLDGMVSENFSGFGTGIDETFYSKAMGMGIFERDIKSAPNELHYNIHRHEIKMTDQSNAIVVTELDLKTTIAEQEIKLNNLRMMMVMHEEGGIVEISGIHISFPTEVHAEGESYPLKELEERNKVLSRMVEEKSKKQQEIICQLQKTEEALRRSEQELKTVINNITDFVSKADVEGKFTYISESNYRLLGYKPGELLGKNILELIHQDDLPTVGAIFQESITEGRSNARVEYRVRKKDGDYIWVETIGSLVLDDNGKASGTLFVSRDISERKQAEEQIKRLAQIADSAPSSIIIHDYEGNIKYANEQTFQMNGYEKEEFMKLNLRDISVPESAGLITARIQEIEEKGVAEFEVRHVRKDGSTFPLRVHAKQTEWFGEPAILGISTDISERKKAEEALRVSEEKSRSILDTLPDLMFIYSRDGYFLDYHASDPNHLAVKPEQFIGKSVFEVFPKELSELFHRNYELAFETHQLQVIDYAMDTPGGLKHYEARISVMDEKQLIIIVRDISDRKQMDKDLSYQNVLMKTQQEVSLDGIIIVNEDDKIVSFNQRFADIWEIPDSIMSLQSGDKALDYVLPKLNNPDEFVNRIRDLNKNKQEKSHEEVILRDGKIFDRYSSPMLGSKGEYYGRVWYYRDITESKKAEEKINYIGFHDQLTDLYNRHYFEKCKEEFKDLPVLSVIMTDVNGLKLINDTYGHGAGDELLKKYADLLRKSFKQSDLFFRWGGDEFIGILKNTDEAKSWELCNRLTKHCGETLVNEIPLSISVGISSKLQGGDIDEAIKEAEDMMYKNKLIESKSSKNLIMKTLLETLSEKSFETKEHIERMGIVGRKIGERLSFSPSELSRLETLTMLHDIGKINLDSHILLKETALTDKEWEEIKKHPEVGYRIICTAEEFAYVAEDILAHHERWDGKGYPQGLQGEDIPYLARLLNIIDSYDVMSNGRPYKKKMTYEEIIEEIESCSGKQFNPDLAEEFIKFLRDGYIGNEY